MKPPLRHIFFSRKALLGVAIFLFVFSLIFDTLYYNRTSVTQEVRAAEKYLHHHEKDFSAFTADTTLIKKILYNTNFPEEFKGFTSKPYGIFLYRISSTGNWSLASWSSQLILPPPEAFSEPDGAYFMHLSNGYYLVKKKMTGTDKEPVLAIAMILIRSDFFLETGYLPQRFTFGNEADKKVSLSEKPTPFPVKAVDGKTIFYLAKKTSGAVTYNDTFTVWLRFAAIFFLLVFVFRLAESVAARKGALQGIGFLLATLILLRVITYYFPAILNLRQFDLFDPSIYGSNIVNRSLGDLLINAVLLSWVVLFAWSKLRDIDDLTFHSKPVTKWITGLLSLCLLISSTLVLATTIRSMVTDSKISFDVTNFFSLNKNTVFGFIVLACLSLSYYYFTQLLFRLIFPLFRGHTYLIYFAIAFTGLVYLTFRSGNPAVLFYIPVLVWLLVYTWLLSRKSFLLEHVRINVAGILFWISVFSVSISVIMLTENKNAEWERRKTYAEKIAVQTDPSSETTLSIGLAYLDNDFLFDNFARFRNEKTGKFLRDSIINANYKTYINKYETKLYVFDSTGKGLYNEDPDSYEALNTILSVQAKTTTTPGLFFYETAFDKFTYITRRDITNEAGKKIGSVFIISNPRQYKSEALLPELFKQFRNEDVESSPIYSYAIYIDTVLVSPITKYPFHTRISKDEIPIGEIDKREKGSYDELWYKVSAKKIVVMTRKRDTVIETITLFSYIFCSFLFLVLFVRLISAVLKIGAGQMKLKKMLQWNIRSQVHGTIIFISFLSFVIIGIATISFFISRYNRNNTDKLGRAMNITVNEMRKKIKDLNTFDDVIKMYDSVSLNNLQNLVNEVADIHGVDVNVYNPQGSLQVSSQANVYNKGVLSKQMDPNAFYHLDKLKEVQHVQKERIADLSYFSIYAPVRDDKGEMYAYLNIPYFASQPELDQEISNFLVTIINLNAFIFLVAGLIALFITNRITSSFSLISNKMKEVNLGQLNEAIAWNRDDEIGDLVKEYNKMVAKLDESADALAKSEREGAWREMARQVAHEIKNPLTPMKLSIQYLQKAINNNQPNVKELSSSVANTLVEQIDHLSKIAADFSQFANIGNTHVELFDLHEVISSLRNLYQPNHNVELEWHPAEGKMMVEADRTQMNRLFTNLLANAVEACHGNRDCGIWVNEERMENRIRISIRDNGEGIPPEMRSRIFVPNFTTKSSGTGLGLAMCKGIVEQAHGKIWFETGEGKGTTFHVELPVLV